MYTFSESFYSYLGNYRSQAGNLTSERITLEQPRISFQYHLGFESDTTDYYCDMKKLYTSVCIDKETNIIYPIVICRTKYVVPDTDCIMDYDVLLVGFDEINKLRNCYQFDLDSGSQVNEYNLKHHCIDKLDTSAEVDEILSICVKRLKIAIESAYTNLNDLNERIDLFGTNLKYWFICDKEKTKQNFKAFKKRIFNAEDRSEVVNVAHSSIWFGCIPDKEFHIEKESIEIQFNPEEYTDGDNIHYLTNAFYDWLGEDLYDRFSDFFYLMNLMVERQRYKEKIKDREFKKKFPLPNEIEEKQKLTISDILSNIAHWIGRIFNKTISWINENPGKIIIEVFYIFLSFVAVCNSGIDITVVIVSISFVIIMPFLLDPFQDK